MNYTLTCSKCNTNLKNFLKPHYSILHCNCKPIIGSYNICSGIFISFINESYNFMKIEFNLSIDNEKNLFYRYFTNSKSKEEEFAISYPSKDFIINYPINFNKNILNIIEEIFIIGNKFKENLLFY